nr:hypothetical protein [Tanacetum cinerariifolium]GEX87528.1 hypothetical protein [Tanacetum cinerariifolium]
MESHPKWHFYFEVEDEETKLIKETPYELLKDEHKKKLGKNNEAKMTLYNTLSCKEYERVFICKTTKEEPKSNVDKNTDEIVLEESVVDSMKLQQEENADGKKDDEENIEFLGHVSVDEDMEDSLSGLESMLYDEIMLLSGGDMEVESNNEIDD